MYDCQVCCVSSNKHTRKLIQCPACEFACCYTCFKTYILTVVESPRCMNCEIAFTLDFVADSTTKTFYNTTFRNARVDAILSKEMSLMPSTQKLAHETNEYRKLVHELNTQIASLNIKRCIHTDINSNDFANITREISELESVLLEQKRNIRNIRNTQTIPPNVRKFICKCTVSDCKGFVSEDWKCGLCGVLSCSKCHRIIEEGHICLKDDVATAQLLKKDTKSCPKCNVSIHKIDGCDQMWCPECHTAFSWQTLQIEKGVIHNPHYYEYMRSIDKLPNSASNCHGRDEMPPIRLVSKKLSNSFPNWAQCHREVTHIKHVELHNYPYADGVLNNVDLRISYLLNELSVEELRTKLLKRMKNKEKNNSIHLILDMYVKSMIDIFWGIVEVDETICEAHVSAQALRNEVNTQLVRVQQLYGMCKIPYINKDWGFKTSNKRICVEI